jgi:peptidoglycan/LPS O-acetylase OafA/YrhL
MQGIGGHEALGASFLGLATAVSLMAVSRLPAGRLVRRCGSLLAWLGSHSYELYLFHIVVLGLMVESVPRAAMPVRHKLPMLAVFFALSAMLAWMAARFCGDPANRWLRDRFAQRSSKAHAVSQALARGMVQAGE